MRDRLYLLGFMLGAGILLYLGRGLLEKSDVVAWGLTFGGTTAVGVLAVTLYRVQQELGASRRELARREAELSFALQVQQSLFPREFPQGEGLEFAAVCVPARGISGDYYDVLKPAPGRLVFTIADVSGKGISAAILMSNIHAVLRVLTTSSSSPREVCSRLNRHFYQVAADSRFATLFYGEWDPGARRLSYINAGHNPPLLMGAARHARLVAGGPPLGIFPDMDYPEASLELEPGDLLVLYSDGITDAGVDRGEPFGEARLEALLSASRDQALVDIQREVLAKARAWARGEAEDDMTLLLVRAGKIERGTT